MFKVFGAALVVLAIAIAVVPMFTDCQSQGKSLATTTGKAVPMKCHWTGVAELATAVPLAVVGAMMVVTRRKGSLLTLGVMGSVLGVFAVLLPTDSLIGVCATPTMLCHTVTKPALTGLGSLAIVGSLGAIVMSRKAQD